MQRVIKILAMLAILFMTGCLPVAPTRSSEARPAPLPTPRVVVATPGLAGDARVGQGLFSQAGCAGCHTLNTVPSANGAAGPNITNVVLRPTLAGEVIPMSPETLSAFLVNPGEVKPGSTMPNLGLTIDEARDLTAYLYIMAYRRF
ncbi:MAG: c-type cytochrome [Chloroflexota bacterium]